METDRALAHGIAQSFRCHVLDECVARIRRCVSQLTPEQIWHHPGPQTNSVANLLLHLAGNTHQWIIAGIAGASDTRDRDAEFAALATADSPSPGLLLDQLEATVREAVTVVEGLSPADLLREYEFQRRFRLTGVAGVLHVLEHFSGHAAQIYAYTKLVKGIDLQFYDL